MPNVAAMMERSLPGSVLEVLRTAASVASREPESARELYLVGGMVRDMLRGEASEDIDLSVVGDGPAFASALASELNGDVTKISEFGTAAVEAGSLSIDVATARDETYEHPGALPTVTPAGITKDLARRDFTINAMAVDLSNASWGELIDPHGGMSDLMMKRIRTLHTDSFADDPTRALRAIRYESRLGFKIQPVTVNDMQRDCGNFDAVSPARALADLRHILDEPQRATSLERAEELGVLGSISPAFRIAGRSLKAIQDTPDREPIFHVALIGARLTQAEAASLIKRLDPPVDWRAALGAGSTYQEIASVLERSDLRPSEIAELLEGFPVLALEAQLQLAPATRQKAALRSWLEELRFREPLLSGDDLLAAGVPQGPLVGRLLAELKRARLDRTVGTRDDELTLVKRRLPVMLNDNGGY
ncbi:MAG: CCA tRNA nucleotidyltransferase [Chloroflexi bacterium]|nr:CCA tRNA nucleotidyltransferase [Chloroflexota bacterium]MBT4072189.1 CCA tRNA nucleotidyltransferase [Chloroflexota bacterium]